jgi:hypothetical protein
MERKIVYITKEIVSISKPSDLDLELDNEFCDSDDDLCIEICKDQYLLHTNVLKLSDLQNIIDEMKAEGADHIEIYEHVDHHGYEIYGSKIRKSTEIEISEYEKKKLKLDQISKDIMEHESQIIKLRNEMKKY